MATAAHGAGTETLTAWLAKHVTDSTRLAIHAGGKDVGYDELNAQVGRLAHSLLRQGIRRGDVVALQLPNSLEFLLSYLAVCSI